MNEARLKKLCRVDPDAVLRAVQKACDNAMSDYRQFRGEEAYHRACGRVEGVLSGAAAVLRSLEGDKFDELLKEVRDQTFAATGELVRMSGPKG